MPIRFVCPLGHPLIVPDELAGGEGQCPVCRERFTVPRGDASPAREHPIQVAAGQIQFASSRTAISTGPAIVAPPLPPETPAASPDAELSALFTLDEQAQRRALATPQSPAPPLAARSYVATSGQLSSAYAIAVVMGCAALASGWPALAALRHPPVGGWVWLVMLLSLTQAAYALWLASLPDWSTVWIGMLLGAVCVGIDAAGLALAMAVPATRLLPFGLEEYRASLGGWSACWLLLHAGLAFAAHLISRGWRRDYERWRASTIEH